MFQEITMVDYASPLAERAKSRKVCGPYRWRPAKPGSGRGFYQDRRYLACGERGSTFRLRLEEANDHLRGSRLAFIDGYFADDHQDTTLSPIIARLPHSRGFLAGWTMGESMLASLDSCVWETEEEAARAAHDLAEYAAEEERRFSAQTEDDLAA